MTGTRDRSSQAGARGGTRRRFGALLVMCGAVAIATTAAAVDVRGVVRVPSDFGRTPPLAEAEARRLFYWNEWNGFIEPRDRGFSAARDLAVVLRGEGEMAEEQPGFRIANGGLWPSTMVERTGGTLVIENTDPVSHQLSATGHSELGPTPTSPGLSRRALVAEAGAWPITDQLYAHVTGHLHVIDDLVARATIGADGAYHFRNVPPGTYTLAIFHGPTVVHTQEGVVVAERELTLEPITIGAAAPRPATPAEQ